MKLKHLYLQTSLSSIYIKNTLCLGTNIGDLEILLSEVQGVELFGFGLVEITVEEHLLAKVGELEFDSGFVSLNACSHTWCKCRW